jgi:hypothetical protein
MKTQIIYQTAPHKAIRQTDGDFQDLPTRVKQNGVVYFINIQFINQIADLYEKLNTTTTE